MFLEYSDIDDLVCTAWTECYWSFLDASFVEDA
jgi:hypothetical protein